MLRVITEEEALFIIDTLHECAAATDDVEDAVQECLEILESLDRVREEDYEYIE